MTAKPTSSPFLQFASNMDAVAVHELAVGQVACYSTRSPDKQSPNEDAFAVLPVSDECAVLAVADGCGGEANGFEAARDAVKAFAKSIIAIPDQDRVRTAILDGFEAATKAVAQVGGGAATTLLAVEITAHTMRTYHTGDSQALLVGSRGKIKLLTRAHSPVGYALEAGVLTEQDAFEHEDRHLVSNVLGFEDTHIDVGLPRELKPRDTLVLGSDGLFDNLTPLDIVTLISKRTLLDATDSMRHIAAVRMQGHDTAVQGKPDDYTSLLFRLHKA